MAEDQNNKENTTTSETNNANEYEDVCYICRRPESVAGKMIHIQNDICICQDCMQKTFDTMNNGSFNMGDFMNMNMGKMPNISMINLADLQNAVPNKQKLKKKKPKEEKNKPELDIHSIPAPHKIKARLDVIIASVPLYNVMAVVILSIFKPGQGKLNGVVLKRTLKGIITNPIILGIAAGTLWSLLRLPFPKILDSTVGNLAKTATPLGLMAMGGSLRFGKAFSRLKASVACTFMKLVGYEALFLPLAIRCGFTQDKLVSIIIMLGSASTVTCFVMAKNMDHEGSFSSGVVLLTTVFSAFTLTLWLFICKNLGLI